MVAFTGAQGFGVQTPGGTGGRQIAVTNLDDSGTGSFRSAVTAAGPRIVTFQVAGLITLQSPVKATDPYLTILGGTAPGPVTLKAAPSYPNECLGIETHDVIVRQLRVRPSPSEMLSESRRAMLVRYGAYNVVIDHCSLSWSTDEIITLIEGAHDITLSWNIFSEPLNRSTHKKGAHSKAVSISGKGEGRVGRVSVHHNLIAHSLDRNPNPACHDVVDIVNNVIYNVDRATNVSDLQARVPVNYVGNYVKKGRRYELMLTETGTGNEATFYVKGNLGPHRIAGGDPEDLVVDPLDRDLVVPTRHPAPTVTTTTAEIAYEKVLSTAGANKYRDHIDTRIVNEVRTGTGSIIDDPAQVGGW